MKRTWCFPLVLLAVLSLRTPALAANAAVCGSAAHMNTVSAPAETPESAQAPLASDTPKPTGTLKPERTPEPTGTPEPETGLHAVDGKLYYYAGGSVQTGWQKVNGVTRYFDPDSGGAMLTGLRQIDGETYCLRGGVLRTGWVETAPGRTRYFDPDSGVMLSGILNIEGRTYYLPDGEVYTGWYASGGVTRYFDPHAQGAMATGACFAEDNMYYFAPNGALAANTDCTLLEQEYHVDKNGVIKGYMTDVMWLAKDRLDRYGWSLWDAYLAAADIPYSDRWLRAPYDSIHTQWYADYGFTNNTGNCYVMNCMLYQMAKLLGYDVYFVEGAVAGEEQDSPHGWCEIEEDGETYVYDSNFLNERGRNGFRIQYGQSGTWAYIRYYRVQ